MVQEAHHVFVTVRKTDEKRNMHNDVVQKAHCVLLTERKTEEEENMHSDVVQEAHPHGWTEQVLVQVRGQLVQTAASTIVATSSGKAAVCDRKTVEGCTDLHEVMSGDPDHKGLHISCHPLL